MSKVFENGSTWFSFRSCCDTYCTVVTWLCLLQPGRHHLGTACHSHHHNSCPTGIRAQTITATKKWEQRQKLLPNFFVNVKKSYLVEQEIKWMAFISLKKAFDNFLYCGQLILTPPSKESNPITGLNANAVLEYDSNSQNKIGSL